MKIAIVTGTRPDIIKMAPFKWYYKRGTLIHSMQHFTYSFYEGVYRDLNIWPPDVEVGKTVKRVLAKKITKYMFKFDQMTNKKTLDWLESKVSKLMQPNIAKGFSFLLKNLSNFFSENYFDWVLIHGDTLTAAAGAIAAQFNMLKVAHIEAGLRTGTKEPFPEQIDTRIADSASDLHFAAVKKNYTNLINEGFSRNKVFLVGNTIVDTVRWAKNKGDKKFFENLGINIDEPFVYFSAHRKENIIKKERFISIVKAANEIANMGYQVLWSIRPATMYALNRYKIRIKNKNIILVDNIPRYTDIVWFISKAKVVVTDSGSMQEEAAALQVPCITLRKVTDRPETVEAGVNILYYPSNKSIKPYIKRALSIKRWPNIYGYNVTTRIIKILKEHMEDEFI